MTESQAKQVKCPQCGRLILYSTDNPFRPFCCERCKLIDLGEWASEGYRIPYTKASSDALTSEEEDDENY